MQNISRKKIDSKGPSPFFKSILSLRPPLLLATKLERAGLFLRRGLSLIPFGLCMETVQHPNHFLRTNTYKNTRLRENIHSSLTIQMTRLGFSISSVCQILLSSFLMRGLLCGLRNYFFIKHGKTERGDICYSRVMACHTNVTTYEWL